MGDALGRELRQFLGLMSSLTILILDILKHMGLYEGIWTLFSVYEGIWKYMEVCKGGPNRPCAQSHIARTAREHEALMARNMMSNHTCSDRPLPTCKASIVVTAMIFTLFKANTKETTKELVRPKAAPPLYIGFE